ncbi:amylovoran biosynthesis protein AmsE [Mannheimia granulomatis]|uniref:Amylovoran biosynthesis protein AmsE n=2 Tax=Mannheimia granulomatis TaxID=85402 RepID=A0A6G8JL47_9PAST|nr:amylovoran biosynthesis protein AmsE [Mannheimia granulomatis]
MCLDSLASQTLPASEIVVVFDGRIPEDLEKIVQKFVEKLPLVVVRLPQNIGLGRALNEGLKHCSNEWVLRMDTDDICLSERFEKQVAFIRNNPDVVLFSGQVEEFDETMSNSLGIKRVPVSCEEIYSSALLRNPFNHMTVAYKKSVIERVGGYQHHLYMEDYNLWLRVIAERYQVSNLPEILVKVRSGAAMYARRKGLDYIKSEYQLAKLKKDLKLQSAGAATICFIIRALPRLLPKSLLGKVYKKLRKG